VASTLNQVTLGRPSVKRCLGICSISIGCWDFFPVIKQPNLDDCYPPPSTRSLNVSVAVSNNPYPTPQRYTAVCKVVVVVVVGVRVGVVVVVGVVILLLVVEI
jgi:hypothetical protein